MQWLYTCGQVHVLAHTLAISLDQSGSRISYAIAMANNLLVFSTDISVAFGESLPPCRVSTSAQTKRSENGGLQETKNLSPKNGSSQY